MGKYLVALSESFKAADEKPSNNGKPAVSPPGPSGKRKRLHILYLLNDVFHHTKYHLEGGASAFVTFSSSLQPHIVELLGYAASYDRTKNPKHHRRLDQLLDVWAENGYYSADYTNKLREAVKNSASVDAIKASVGIEDSMGELQQKGPQRDAPFVMPAVHGDPSTPYYDLPAGNFVPHIIPDSSTPIRPDSVKPLQFLAGPADQKLITALKKFLKDVDRIYGSNDLELDDNAVVDIDELGQTVIRDEKTGDILDGDTYYGWSREFCQQMKRRRGRGSRYSRSRSRSSSSEDGFQRRRRYSDTPTSEEGGRAGRRSRNRSHSGERRRGRRYSSSRSRSPSRSGYRDTRSRSGSRPRSGSYSPRPASPPRSFPPRHQPYLPSQDAPPPPPQFAFNDNQPFQSPSMGPSGMSIPAPPPPPPNYNGPWPPPPPPLPPGPMPGFTPPFPLPSGQYPQPSAPGQLMPPGSYPHPPPPPPWGAPGGPSRGRGGYPQRGGGRWR